jgi:hypothetical protein
MEEITVVTASVNRIGLRKAAVSVQAQTLRPKRHCILLQQMMRSPVIDLMRPTSVPIEIRWLPPPQPNIVEAYCAVEEMADTPLIAMLDDDCWWEPNHLEVLARLMEEKQADFVWASTIIHDLDRGLAVIGQRDDKQPAFQHIDTNEILFRRDCIDRWGSFDIKECDPNELPKLRGIDGRRIERWVRGGAVYAHSGKFTVHYGYRPVPEF